MLQPIGKVYTYALPTALMPEVYPRYASVARLSENGTPTRFWVAWFGQRTDYCGAGYLFDRKRDAEDQLTALAMQKGRKELTEALTEALTGSTNA